MEFQRLLLKIMPVPAEMWSTGFYVCIALIVVCPFCVTYQFLVNLSYFGYLSGMDCFNIRSTLNMQKVYDVLLPFVIVVTIFNAVINTTSVVKLFSFNKSQRRAPEVNLFFMSLVQFIIELFVGTIV
ncbi:hypothetical protein TELCIR_05050, partial [Teladorsagia circumcincta]